MQLTAAQKTAFKSHAALNTNTATRADGGTFTINTRLATGDAQDEQAIADWYNGTALAGDAQAPANLRVWNPRTTIDQLKTAIDWATSPPHGLGGNPSVSEQQLAINNKWWAWDKLTQGNYLDMSDPQVRAGVLQVWGNVASPSSAASIGASGCGALVGKRIELTLAGAAVGNVTAWAAAHVVQKDKNGSSLIGQTITQDDVHDALLNG